MIFKEWKWSTVRNSITKLTTPACVRITGEARDVTRCGRYSIDVGHFIVVGWEMIKCLKCGIGSRVVADAIVGSAVKVFESM